MRLAATALALMVATVACSPNPSPAPSPEPLAGDQTLSFPIAQEVGDFDPAMISSPADVDVLRNVFSGLYRFDDSLKEVPDIAAGPPTVSADGLTYTFRIRTDARFSNGDPISAADFVYSWNRAAARQGDFAGLFSVVVGYHAVANGQASAMSGVASPDPATITVKLVKPAGWFLTLVGLWPFWVVDRNVIASAGEDAWSTKPDTLVGSGPFRMTARIPGQSMDFEPVSGWYGGSTGRLTRVHVDVVPDAATQLSQYQAGVYGVVGYARQSLTEPAATRYTTDANLKGQLRLVPLGLTFWAGFNLRAGPFAGVDAGRAGRHAFSEAIDRKALAGAVCNHGTSCAEATGGVVSKGLLGYLGDDQDPNVKFDAKAAKAEYGAWDPAGTKVKGLVYTYDTNAFNKAVCANLQAQWKKNLDVFVDCVEMDRKTFFDQRNGKCAYSLFRQGWIADYDHPQSWFDNLFVTGAPWSGSCYSNPNFDAVIGRADARAPGPTAKEYRTAGYMLVDDAVFVDLLYGVQAYLVHPYVRGAGGNALYDNYWTEVRILRR
jgi:oligopeptide transport system substrate-binding protein